MVSRVLVSRVVVSGFGIQSFGVQILVSNDSFHEALDTSTILMNCHNDLKTVGLDCKLESGTRLYLLPEQHADTMRAVVGLNLQSRHVIASTRFVDAVTQAIATIMGREQVSEKKRQRVHFEQDCTRQMNCVVFFVFWPDPCLARPLPQCPKTPPVSTHPSFFVI